MYDYSHNYIYKHSCNYNCIYCYKISLTKYIIKCKKKIEILKMDKDIILKNGTNFFLKMLKKIRKHFIKKY
jgi:hypothetical protein